MTEPATQETECSVREITFDDFAVVREVACRNGLGSPTYTTANWLRLWNDSPFCFSDSPPLGWVLETRSQGIVGTLINTPRMYVYNDEPVRAAVAGCWAVDPPGRFASILLIERFVSQKGGDLFFRTTASSRAAAVFKAFGWQETPAPSYKSVLFWITRYTEFAGALLRKALWPEVPGLRHAAGMVLFGRDMARRPRVRYQRVETCTLSRFDERFDALWEVLRLRPNRLLAVRTRDALAWQFGPSLENGNAAVIAVPEGGGLAGYLIMKRQDQEQVGLRRFGVVDIQVARDEPDLILSMMAAALEHAAHSGVDVVEAVGFNKWKRDLLERLNPHHRTYPSCPYLYKARSDLTTLRAALAHTDAWDPSQIDGDASL
jgi:hypothetical protein